MLPASGGEGGLGAFRVVERDGGAAGVGGKDAADAGEGDSGEGAGDAGEGRGGEEEFVVLAAVEGLGLGGQGVDGDGGEVELGTDLGGGAEVGEVGGEAVGEVDAGGGTGAEGLAGAEAGLRVEVRVGGGSLAGLEVLELGGGATEGAGDVE